MKRRAFTLVEAFILVAVVAVLGMLLFPIFAGSRDNPHHPTCQSNLKQIGLGFMQYVQDYNETFPSVAMSAPNFGWADGIQPYLKSTRLYQCPNETTSSSALTPRANGYTDYWMNRNLSGATRNLPTPAFTILSGDGNAGVGGTNARYSKATLPATWLTSQNSPAYRHQGMMNLLFADGHVKLLPPQSVVASPSLGYSFALK